VVVAREGVIITGFTVGQAIVKILALLCIVFSIVEELCAQIQTPVLPLSFRYIRLKKITFSETPSTNGEGFRK